MPKNRRRVYEHYAQCIQSCNLAFLKSQVVGFTINFCCGCDPNGDVKVDVDRGMLLERKKGSLDRSDFVVADVKFPPFRGGCCETLIVDPPFSFFNRFKWLLDLARLSTGKVIVSHPGTNLKLPGFGRVLFFTNSNGIFLRLWWVFIKKSASRDPVKKSLGLKATKLLKKQGEN